MAFAFIKFAHYFMIKLTVDQGNSNTKLAVFNQDEMIEKISNVDDVLLSTYLSKFDRVIISSVKNKIDNISLSSPNIICLNSTTLLPIKNVYQTPHSLGNDRIALAVGANFLFPKKDVLIIDAGTCMTFDFINKKGQYLGGAISPGLTIRYQALNTFTAQLPLLTPSKTPKLIGANTEESIQSGIINGMRSEIDGIIYRYTQSYPDIIVILTGGDAIFFDKGLKNTIFANPDLLMIGLNKILDYNEPIF